jgi:cytosine/adenosine deaminase-related metal-dependent hydrolase
MQSLWADWAFTGQGWRRNVHVTVADDGRIAEVEPDRPHDGEERAAILLPAPVNLHSHAFIHGGIITMPGDRPTFIFLCSVHRSARAWLRRCIFQATRCSRETRCICRCQARRRAAG